MNYVARGIALVFGQRRFWPYIWRPWLLSAGIFVAIVVLGLAVAVPLGTMALSSMGVATWLGGSTIIVAYGVALWFLAGIVFTSLTGIMSSFLWEKLSLEVERTVRADAPQSSLENSALITDSLIRMSFATLIFCGTAGCFWFLPMGVALASWLSLYDYTASTYLRRNVTFPVQFRTVFRNKPWPLFSLTCGLLTLIPFVNVLLLPGLVAGATLMVVENELKAS